MPEKLDPRIHEQLQAFDEWENYVLDRIRSLDNQMLAINLLGILRNRETSKVKGSIKQGQALECNSLRDFTPLKDLEQKLRDAGLEI